jgi:hypothetical protein
LRSYTEQLGLAAAEALVLDAAREYFNGASSTLDPALERMAECLRVLPQTTPAVEAEFRLLEGVKLLARYGCTPPPLQVRRLPDRLVLVHASAHHGAVSSFPHRCAGCPIGSCSCLSSSTASLGRRKRRPHARRRTRRRRRRRRPRR